MWWASGVEKVAVAAGLICDEVEPSRTAACLYSHECSCWSEEHGFETLTGMVHCMMAMSKHLAPSSAYRGNK